MHYFFDIVRFLPPKTITQLIAAISGLTVEQRAAIARPVLVSSLIFETKKESECILSLCFLRIMRVFFIPAASKSVFINMFLYKELASIFKWDQMNICCVPWDRAPGSWKLRQYVLESFYDFRDFSEFSFLFAVLWKKFS